MKWKKILLTDILPTDREISEYKKANGLPYKKPLFIKGQELIKPGIVFAPFEIKTLTPQIYLSKIRGGIYSEKVINKRFYCPIKFMKELKKLSEKT